MIMFASPPIINAKYITWIKLKSLYNKSPSVPFKTKHKTLTSKFAYAIWKLLTLLHVMQHFTNYKQGLSINQNAQKKKLDNHRFLQDYFIGGHFPTRYRKIPNVSPSKYKSPGACTWIIALKYKVKLQSKITFNYSWFATTWQGGHVGGENKRIFPRRIYMKIEFSSQRREMLLFLTTNMAAVTSRANQQ